MWDGLVPWNLWLMVGEGTQIESLVNRAVPANWERAGAETLGRSELGCDRVARYRAGGGGEPRGGSVSPASKRGLRALHAWEPLGRSCTKPGTPLWFRRRKPRR